jgi:hypothetical protein
MQQHQKRLPAAAFVDPQTRLHSRSLPPRHRAPGPAHAGIWVRSVT